VVTVLVVQVQQAAVAVLAQSVQIQQALPLEMVAQVHHLLSVVHLLRTLEAVAVVDKVEVHILAPQSLEELQVLVAELAEMEKVRVQLAVMVHQTLVEAAVVAGYTAIYLRATSLAGEVMAGLE
jgi:hypothetical protein